MDDERAPGKRPRRLSGALKRCLTFASAALIWGHTVAPAAAQLPGPREDERAVPPWVGQFTVLGANALLGGLTAGIAQELRGGSFSDGFTRGFLGGSIVYVGKRVAVEHFAGAGLLGRTVASAGASVVRNASEARPALARLILPFGPLRLYVNREADPGLRLKVDLNTVIMTGVALGHSGLDLDAGSSLSAGAPVFVTREHLFGSASDTTRASGEMLGNVIFLSELPWRSDEVERELFAHERVHLLQRDQFFTTITEPLGAELIERTPLSPLYRYVDVHFTDLLFSLMSLAFRDYYDRPWEMEAYHLMKR